MIIAELPLSATSCSELTKSTLIVETIAGALYCAQRVERSLGAWPANRYRRSHTRPACAGSVPLQLSQLGCFPVICYRIYPPLCELPDSPAAKIRAHVVQHRISLIQLCVQMGHGTSVLRRAEVLTAPPEAASGPDSKSLESADKNECRTGSG